MIGPGSDKDQTDRITKGGISIFLTTKRKLLATIIWMTATRGAINVMPASKSQLQKVVLPPLRRASQRKGLPPGPPGPPRPIKAYQAPGRHKAHRAHCPQGAAGLPHKAGKLHAPLVQEQAAGRASPSSCGGQGHSCSTVTPLLKT